MTINYLAVLIGGVVSMIIGGLWYSKILFGKTFMEESHMTEQSKADAKAKGMIRLYVAQLILALITSYVLAHFIVVLQISSVSEVLALVFWLWLGFQFTLAAGSAFWEGKSKKLFIIKAFHNLVTLAVVGIILVFI